MYDTMRFFFVYAKLFPKKMIRNSWTEVDIKPSVKIKVFHNFYYFISQ